MNSFLPFIVFGIAISLLSYVFSVWLFRWVKARHSDNKRIAEIGGFIREGANTFLKKEYILLAKFAAVVTALIVLFLPKPLWNGQPSGNIMMACA